MINVLTTQSPPQNPGNFHGTNCGANRGGGSGNRGGRGGRGGFGQDNVSQNDQFNDTNTSVVGGWTTDGAPAEAWGGTGADSNAWDNIAPS